jgi:hypothetical protein
MNVGLPNSFPLQASSGGSIPPVSIFGETSWDSYLEWDDIDLWLPAENPSNQAFSTKAAVGPYTANSDWNISLPQQSTVFPNDGFFGDESSMLSVANIPQLPGDVLGSDPVTLTNSEAEALSTQSPASDLSHRLMSFPMVPQLSKMPGSGASFQPQVDGSRESSIGHEVYSREHPSPVRSTLTASSENAVVDSGKKRRLNSEQSSESGVGNPKRAKDSKKAAHKMVEKRYRMNLNTKFSELRDCVPTLCATKSSIPSDEEENATEGGANEARSQNSNKAQILSQATHYIHQLERQIEQLRSDNEILRKMSILRGLAAAEATDATAEEMQSQSSLTHRNVNHARKPIKITSAAHSPLKRRDSKGNILSKALMGSLAGLAVLEGLGDHYQHENLPRERGLFALPSQLLNYLTTTRPHMPLLGPNSVGVSLLSMLKIVLASIVFAHFIFPFLFERTATSQKANGQLTANLIPTSSLAAPVEVRRKAWLTSIQTVWVPRSNFILEICAVALKLVKIFVRNAFGWQWYVALTGATEEDEAARIKAWDIALDAQLAGGDPALSLDRLLLTFLASLTLPISPSRSALKSLHAQLAGKILENRFGRWFGFSRAASKVAAFFWDRAWDLNDTVQADAVSPLATASHVLPDHLALLLQNNHEQVFTDDIKQRAYNLATNKSTDEGIEFRDQGMDSVVGDLAIFSPLDALAAWRSCEVLRRSLLNLIESPTNGQVSCENVLEDLALALRTAPPRSGTQLRCQVAIAAFQAKDRKPNVSTAIDMMNHPCIKSALSSANLENRVSGFDSLDVRIAIRCAMLKYLVGKDDVGSHALAQPSRLLKSLANILENKEIGLLGFAAAYELLQWLCADENRFRVMQVNISNLAVVLRTFIGRRIGRDWHLELSVTRHCVQVCLDICKKASGIEQNDGAADPGYWSSAEGPKRQKNVDE